MASFVTYFRVSTARQGASGLGIEAQQAAVTEYVKQSGGKVLASFTEVESGKKNDRPKLVQAMERCRLTGAMLLIAKLDRLSRDAHFLIGLEKAGVEFVAADMPQANRLTVGIMALVAQQEREAISARTKAALAAAKARGTKLGGYREGARKVDYRLSVQSRQAAASAFSQKVGPMVAKFYAEGIGLRQVAARLNEMGIKTPRGGGKGWTASGVRRVLYRINN
ncbi:recombinase family protein [Acetobacter indonesiensis]|uniref:recombinase family protein n=1 Tax=Acetobacter indonesiensis TaxID=104101 RepID=UPI001F2344F4|nr:recombinase family protein [Acetobacter indonesiensis]MCG0995018.1 recombinase family protein [Acetobacter indonesiensis]